MSDQRCTWMVAAALVAALAVTGCAVAIGPLPGPPSCQDLADDWAAVAQHPDDAVRHAALDRWNESGCTTDDIKWEWEK